MTNRRVIRTILDRLRSTGQSKPQPSSCPTQEQRTSSFLKLPVEILVEILSHLDVPSFLSIRLRYRAHPLAIATP